MAMTLAIENKDGSEAGFSLITYLITKYFDKYGTAEITCTPHETIQENSILEATFKGSVRFRGFIDIPEINEDKTARIVAYELQRLLEYRFTQFYTYAQGTTITNMITHAEPATAGVVGLLYMANSLIPQGAFTLYSGAVYYIKDYLARGGGTGSKFGTITKMYANATLLTHGASPTLAAGSWYQNGTDLYVRMPDDRDPQYWLVSIPNWKDTKLRLSSSVALVSVLPTPYRLGKTSIAIELDRMVKSFGKEWQWYHDTNGYTYLNVATTVGRGTPISGIVNFRENDTIYTYAEDQTGDPRIDGLVGCGAGSGVTQNVYSLLNLYGAGTWKEDVYEDSHQFTDQLKNSMALILPDKLEPLAITITADEDPAVAPGDYANILKETSLPITKRIKQIEYANDGEMRVMLGQRPLDISDVTKNKYDLLGSYNDFVNSAANSWSFTFNNDNISSGGYGSVATPYTQTFSIALDEIDTSYPYRFRMDINVGFYKDPAGTVTANAHGHTNSTGVGGACGGGGASAQHAIPAQNVSGPTVYGISGGYMGNGGTHAHSLTSSSGTTSSASAVTSVSPSFGCSTFSCVSSVGYSYGGHSHGYATTPGMYGAGDHNHILTLNVVALLQSAYYNASTTSSGGSHGDHNTNHTNGVYTENATATIQDSFAKLIPVGASIHFLILTVKVNGSSVPGSPFNDYYPGESISDIDITSLVTTSGQNTITVSISEYGGAAPVRCALYGSVHSLYVLTSI